MDTKENKIINKEECIQLISRWFLSDTVEFLDLVLKDDTVDPNYSAITALNRLYIYIQYKRQEDGTFQCQNVSSFMSEMGYSETDLILFGNKVRKEKDVYRILLKKFLNPKPVVRPNVRQVLPCKKKIILTECVKLSIINLKYATSTATERRTWRACTIREGIRTA